MREIKPRKRRGGETLLDVYAAFAKYHMARFGTGRAVKIRASVLMNGGGLMGIGEAAVTVNIFERA